MPLDRRMASRVQGVSALQEIEGVAESALADDDAARLPGASAPAPWGPG